MRRHRLPHATIRQDEARLLTALRHHDHRTTRELADTAGLTYDRTYRALTNLERRLLVLSSKPDLDLDDPALIWHLTDRGARTRPTLHDLDPRL